MSVGPLTRRGFLRASVAVTAAAAMGCPPRPRGNGVVAFKRSGRGRHVSNAAKKNNANKIYLTEAAAAQDAAHPGDNSKVVEITIPKDSHDRYFGTGDVMVDLRHL